MMIQIVPAIKRLSLTRVGCWSNLVIDFTSGLNIITGDCGCGKSTILRAMLQAVQPLVWDQYALTPTYPSTSGTIGIEFNRDSVVIDIPVITGIPEKKDVYESHGQFMLSQLRSHIAGATCGFALLIEDAATAGLDNLQFRQAIEALNTAKSQIISIIGHRFSLKDFPDARVYRCYPDDKRLSRIERIQ